MRPSPGSGKRHARIPTLLRRPVIPLAILVFLGGWLSLGPARDSPYVVYRNQVQPATDAGQHVCHDVLAPQIRCFDTVQELIDDLESISPWHAARFRTLWLATWPPSMTP